MNLDNSETGGEEKPSSDQTGEEGKKKLTRRQFLKYAGAAAATATAAGLGGKALFDSLKKKKTGIESVIVIGGGIAGLVAAYELTKANKNVTLLESCHRLGGRLGSYIFPNGQIVDVGTEEWFSTDTPVTQLVQELGLYSKAKDMAEEDYPAGYWKNQYITSKSTDDWDILHHTLRDRGIITPEAATAWEKAVVDVFPIFTAWTDSSEKLYDYWYMNYLNYDDITFREWYQQNWSDDESFDWLINVLLKAELGTTTEKVSAGEGLAYLGYYWWDMHYYHLEGGNQQLADALAQNIGFGNIRTSSPVTSVSNNSSEDGVVVQLEDGESINADAAVVAVPFTKVQNIVDDLIQEKKDALNALIGSECIIPVQQYLTRFYNDGTDFETIWLNSDSPVNYYVDAVRHEPGDTGSLVQYIVSEEATAHKALTTVGNHVREPADLNRITDLVLDTMDNFWVGGRDIIQEKRVFQYDHYGPAYPPRYLMDYHYMMNRLPIGRIQFAGDYLYEFGIGAAVISGQAAAARLI